MSEHVKDPSEDLAQWLSDAGRRTWRSAAVAETSLGDRARESSGDLFRYLEELAGRELRSRDDIRRYVGELSAPDPEANRTHRRQRLVKDTVLLLCLLTAYIQYNFLDVNLQIARLPSIVIFVPVDAMNPPPRSGVQARRGDADHAGAIAVALPGQPRTRAEVVVRRA
jgi:hypothetical protein